MRQIHIKNEKKRKKEEVHRPIKRDEPNETRPNNTRPCFKTYIDRNVMLLLKRKSKWSRGHSVVPNMDEKL